MSLKNFDAQKNANLTIDLYKNILNKKEVDIFFKTIFKSNFFYFILAFS